MTAAHLMLDRDAFGIWHILTSLELLSQLLLLLLRWFTHQSDKPSQLSYICYDFGKKTHYMQCNVLISATLIFESKDTVTTSILPEFDPLMETKPELILIKQKKKRNNFVCLTCKVDQGNYEAFNEHLKIHPLECLTCGKLFYRRANLVLHMKIHLGIKNYK